MALSLFLPKPDQYRFWIALVVLSLFGKVLYAANYYSNPAGNVGNFNAASVWSLTPGGATVAFPGTTHTFYITSGDNITLSVAQTAGGIIVTSGGTLTNGGTFTLTCPQLTIDAGGTLNIIATIFTIAGSWTNNGSITLTSGRLIYSTGAGINNGSITYSVTGGQLVKSSGTLTNGATGTISITGTATVTLSTGNFVNNNTSSSVNFGASAIAVSGTTGQSVGGFTTTGLFSATNASGTITLTGNVNASGLTKSSAGTLNMGTGTHTFSTAAVTLTAGILDGGTSTINVNFVSATAWTGTGSVFTPTNSTVNFGGAGNQTLSATSTTFYNLTFSNSGTKTIAAGTTITVTNNWNVNSTTTMTTTAIANVTGNVTGSGNITVGTGTIFLEGSWTNNGTLTPGTGTISYDGAGAQTIAVLPYYKLATVTGGVKTLAADVTVTNVVTIGASSTLDLSTFTLFLSFTGAPLVNSGTISGTGTVNYSGSGVQTVLGTTYPNLEYSGTGTKTILTTTTATVTNNWIVGSPATLATTGSANVTGNISGSGAITMASGTIFLEGSWTNNGTFTPGTGTVNYDGAGAQTIAALTYAKLQTSTGGIKTLAANTTANNIVTIGASTTLNLSSFTLFLTFTGAPLVNSGTISGTGEVNYSGANQTVAGTTYTNLELSGTGTKTVLAGTTITTTTNWIITSTTLLATTAAASIAGSISGAGTLTMGSGTISLAGSWTKTGTFTPGTGTVNYDAAGDQTIAALTYAKLQTSTGGIKTLAGNTTANNIVTISASTTLNLSSFTLFLTFTGAPLVNSGTISGTGEVNYSGANQTVAGTTYTNLELSGTGTKTVLAGTTITTTTNWIITSTTSLATTAAASIAGSISGAGALTMGSGTISLAGSWTKTGTFTAGTGTINYNGTTQTIATLAYYKLQTSSSGVKTLAASTTVSNVLTINSPSTIDLSTFTLTLSGAGTPLVNNGTFTASTSTVNYTNTASTTIAAVNYNNLNGTGGARTLAGTGIIGIASTFTKGAGAYTVTGSTVNFNGSGAQTIPAFTFNDLILSGSLAKTILTGTVVNVNTIEIQNGPTLDLPGTAQLNITKP